MSDYDVVVVGGGAAGLSAALVLCRALRTVAVVDAHAPRNASAGHVHGFLSHDGLSPRDLISAGRREVAGYGAALLDGRVRRLERGDDRWFRVLLADGRVLTGRRLIVATGMRDELPDIPGAAQRWGRDLLHCPYCHGYEVRGQALGVLGGSSRAIHQAQLVRQLSDDVVYFADGGALSADQRDHLLARRIRIEPDPVTGLVVGDDALRGIVVSHGRTVARSALFVSPHGRPNAELLADLGCDFDDYGWVEAHPSGRTSVAGVWVVGNVVNPRAQVITAAGQGCTAAMAVNWDLVGEDVRDELRDLAGTSDSQRAGHAGAAGPGPTAAGGLAATR